MDYSVKVFLNRYFLSSMPDEFDFKDYKSLEEYAETLEGSKYFHGLYLRAVNHPIRRQILHVVNEREKVSEDELFNELQSKNLVNELSILEYNLDFLVKALCIEKVNQNSENYYVITQLGKVIEHLK
jgi:hypothetical protein